MVSLYFYIMYIRLFDVIAKNKRCREFHTKEHEILHDLPLPNNSDEEFVVLLE